MSDGDGTIEGCGVILMCVLTSLPGLTNEITCGENALCLECAATLSTMPDLSGVVEALERMGKVHCLNGRKWPTNAPDCGDCFPCQARQALSHHREGKQWSDEPEIEMRRHMENSEAGVWIDIKGRVWIAVNAKWYGPIHPPKGEV